MLSTRYGCNIESTLDHQEEEIPGFSDKHKDKKKKMHPDKELQKVQYAILVSTRNNCIYWYHLGPPSLTSHKERRA